VDHERDKCVSDARSGTRQLADIARYLLFDPESTPQSGGSRSPQRYRGPRLSGGPAIRLPARMKGRTVLPRQRSANGEAKLRLRQIAA